MFYIPIPVAELGRLDTCGTQVRINGRPQTLRREGRCLMWTDERGKQIRPILEAEEVEIDSHSCIRFICGE